jgi:hypothetical protein
VSIVRKIAHKAEAARRRPQGRWRCHRQPPPAGQGRRDQVKGSLKLAGAKIKDAFRR